MWRLHISIPGRPWTRELCKEHLRFRSCQTYHVSLITLTRYCLHNQMHKNWLNAKFEVLERKTVLLLNCVQASTIQNQGQTKGWPSQMAAPGVPTFKWCCQWNNKKYGTSKLRFPHVKEFLQKWSTVWRLPAVRGWETLKNISCPGHPYVLAWPYPRSDFPSASMCFIYLQNCTVSVL